MQHFAILLLKKCRNERKLSQKGVFNLTGITDSRISKAEREGSIKNFSVNELKILSKTYNIPIVEMLIKLGCLTVSDLKEFQSGFKGVSVLDAEEKNHIQNEIDFLNRKKGAKNDL